MPQHRSLPQVERDICLRLGSRRRFERISQEQLAKSVGLTRDQLAKIEARRVPLKFWVAWKLCAQLNINPYWLATGKGDESPFIDLDLSDYRSRIIDRSLFSEVCLRLLAGAFSADTFGSRLRLARSAAEWTLEELAERTGYPRSLLDDIEHDRQKASAGLLDALVEDLHVNIDWLRSAKSPVLLEVPPPRSFFILPKESLEKERQKLDELRDKAARLVRDANSLETVIRESEHHHKISGPPVTGRPSKASVDIEGASEHSPTVTFNTEILPQLIRRVQRVTARRGVRAQLARDLAVTRQAVNNWLTGASAPSAEVTLRLLKWVEAAEKK